MNKFTFTPDNWDEPQTVRVTAKGGGYDEEITVVMSSEPSEAVTGSVEVCDDETLRSLRGSLRGRRGEGEDKPASVTLTEGETKTLRGRLGEIKLWNASLDDGRYEWVPVDSPADRIRWDYPSAAHVFMPVAICFLDGKPVGHVEYHEGGDDGGYVHSTICGVRGKACTIAEAMHELQERVLGLDK